MTKTIHCPDGRLAHLTAVASLSESIRESPAELNGVVVEYLDLLASWVFAYHPSISEPDLFYIDYSKADHYRTLSRFEARERMRVLGDALEVVIGSHARSSEFDVSKLSAIPECHEVDIELGMCRDDGMELGQKLLSVHGEATRLLTRFQKVHVCGDRETAPTGESPTYSDDVAKPRRRPATVNERMWALLTENPEDYVGWTAKKWAAKLKCSDSTVKGTKAWKTHLARNYQGNSVQTAGHWSEVE